MKKLTLILLVICVLTAGCITVTAEDVVYPITGENNVRILGRGEFLGEGIRTFNWSNAGFEFEFSGTKAEVYVNHSNNDDGVYEGNYFNTAVYNGDSLVRVERKKLVKGWNTIYEKKSGDPERAKIMLVRSSEACRGTLMMSKIRCDAKPTATAPREKLIEFIGDSYTAGFANSPALSDNTWYCAQNTDNWNSYTGFVARHYNADNNVIAYQGKGVYANQALDKLDNTMSHQFMYREICTDGSGAACNMSTKAMHNFKDYQPQLAVIWLGTNDSAAPVDNETFKTAYALLADNVRDKYPNATILNIALKGSRYHDVIAEVVNGEGRGEKEGFYMLSLNTFATSFLGHPDIAEDERIANQIIGKIDSIPGVWDIKREDATDTEQLSLRANYNTGEVSAFGTTGKSGDSVSVVVMKPGTALGENIEKSDVVYISQTEADAVGEYSFDFVADRMEGVYQFYLNTTATDSLKNREFAFINLIPTLSVTSAGNKVEKMTDLSDKRDLKVVLSGFDMENGFSGMLAVAQYKNEVLYDIAVENVNGDTQMYGTEVIINEEIKPETDKIKIFFMNKTTLVPVIGSYDI